MRRLQLGRVMTKLGLTAASVPRWPRPIGIDIIQITESMLMVQEAA